MLAANGDNAETNDANRTRLDVSSALFERAWAFVGLDGRAMEFRRQKKKVP